jgi:hypothetical protein
MGDLVGLDERQEAGHVRAELENFNEHIVGQIEVISEWRGQPPIRAR